MENNKLIEVLIKYFLLCARKHIEQQKKLQGSVVPIVQMHPITRAEKYQMSQGQQPQEVVGQPLQQQTPLQTLQGARLLRGLQAQAQHNQKALGCAIPQEKGKVLDAFLKRKRSPGGEDFPVFYD